MPYNKMERVDPVVAAWLETHLPSERKRRIFDNLQKPDIDSTWRAIASGKLSTEEIVLQYNLMSEIGESPETSDIMLTLQELMRLETYMIRIPAY